MSCSFSGGAGLRAKRQTIGFGRPTYYPSQYQQQTIAGVNEFGNFNSQHVNRNNVFLANGKTF